MAAKPVKINVRMTLIAALASASWQAAAQQPSSPTLETGDFPPWVNEAMQRESGPFVAQPVTLPARNFTSELYGKALGEIQQTELGWYLSTDIEGTTPMECWIFTSPVDMAASLRNILNLNLSASAKLNGEITDRALFYVDSGMIGNYSYMAIESFYAMQGESQNLTGFAKVRIARLDDIHLACSHNQLGYREIFARNFEHFVQSASFDEQAIEPYYRQVYRQSMDGLGIGIMELLFAIDADGDVAVTSKDSMMLVAPTSEVQASDTYEFSYWKTDLALINQVEVGSSNGNILYNLNLQPASEGLFQVSGEYQGEKIQFGIEHGAGPMSAPERMLEFQKLLADPNRNSMTVRMWQVDFDASRIIDSTISFSDGAKPALVASFSNEATSMNVQYDKAGSIVDTEIETGNGLYRMQRVHEEGRAPTLTGDN